VGNRTPGNPRRATERSAAETLRRPRELLDDGTIRQAEFDTLKAKPLS
jgi:hypothetical protein